ncbi:Hypothetical predicted protein [Octopus vulgaris]|uniref:Uncharacterized protein n=1 Tax=Octopus vulgaris TaxID=6645 RepID=A0AA36B4K3_OCTVU|nr:Hypothetical predicted protein [Octopus vulgaris]
MSYIRSAFTVEQVDHIDEVDEADIQERLRHSVILVDESRRPYQLLIFQSGNCTVTFDLEVRYRNEQAIRCVNKRYEALLIKSSNISDCGFGIIGNYEEQIY